MPQPNWFIALVVPPVAGWHHAGDTLPPGLRRFDPADLHLTLAFLGNCSERLAWAAWSACGPLHHPAITASAGSWKAMGPEARPSAYALTLRQGREPISRLIEDFRKRLQEVDAWPASASPGTEPPLPHITIARPRRREESHGGLDGRGPDSPEALILEHLALYTWNADRSVRMFRRVAQRPLQEKQNLASVSR